jgi:hypothetical protein
MRHGEAVFVDSGAWIALATCARARAMESSMRQARSFLSSETKCNTPADLIIGTADQDLRECCHAMLFAFVG